MDTFCILPWFSEEIGKKITSCCLLPIEHDINQIKKDLLNGVQNKSCKKCWDMESNGLQSRRQQENIFLDYKLNQDLDQIRQTCLNDQHKTLLYQITTSNLCNQACVTCNSEYSSKWARVEQKMQIIPSPLFEFDTHNHDINYQSARRISLLGGEPLFDPTTFKILQKLVDNNNTDCFVSLITNGSISLSRQQCNLLKQFSDLNICISIDGVGPVFEYLRWPGKWEKLLQNLELYKTIAKNTSISYTISSLNAMYYNSTVEWFKKNNLPYNHNIISRPTWLSLSQMPVEFKKHLAECGSNLIESFCKINGNETALSVMVENIAAQDRAKKINIKDYLPEVADVLFGTV